MIGTFRSQSGESMVWEREQPFVRGENPIKSLKGWVVSPIAPREAATIKMQLVYFNVIKEYAEATHQATIQNHIVFIFRLVDEIEIPTQEPGASTSPPGVPEVVQELCFLSVPLGTVYTSEPPLLISIFAMK